MFILTTLNQLITSTDNYGSIVNFNYFKNSNKHKSFCGGISTILLIMFVTFFAIFKGVLMIKGDNIKHDSNVESVDIRELFIPDLK